MCLSNDNTGDPTHTLSVTSNLTHGSLTLNNDGSFEYIPTSGYVGNDSFTYQITDNNSETASAVVTISVTSNATYNVTYSAPDATGPTTPTDTNDYMQGATVTISTDEPTRDGYTFDGWTKSGDATVYKTGTVNSSFAMPDSDVTLNANWTAVNSNVTYAAGTSDTVTGMPSPLTTSHATDSTVSISASEPSRAGYTFAGWTTSFDANTYDKDDATYNEFTMPTSAVTLTASWTAVSNNVTYATGTSDTVTGMPSPLTTSHATDSTVSISASEPSRAGYTFAGWTTSFDANTYDKDDATYNEFTMPTSAVTLTASWTAGNQTLAYDAGAAGTNAANMPSDSSHATSSTVTISSTEPTWTDHTFDGWLSSEDSNTYRVGGTTQFTMPANTVTMTAQWSDTEYSVSYSAHNADSGVPSDSNTYIVGADVTVGTAPTRTGYEFAGWDDGSTIHPVGDTTPMVSGGITLTAVWNQIHTLSYDAGAAGTNAADMPSDSSYAATTTATVSSTVPTWTDHTFDGWTTSFDANTYTGGDAFAMPDSDATLTAQWSDTEYSVSYSAPNADSGVPSDSNTYIVGADVTVGSAPARAGYDFVGWDDGSTTHSAGDTTPMVSGGLTFTAVWDKLTEATDDEYSTDVNSNTECCSSWSDGKRYTRRRNK